MAVKKKGKKVPKISTVPMYFCPKCKCIYATVAQTFVAKSGGMLEFNGEEYEEENDPNDNVDWEVEGKPYCFTCLTPVVLKDIDTRYVEHLDGLFAYLGLNDSEGIPLTELNEKNIFNILV